MKRGASKPIAVRMLYALLLAAITLIIAHITLKFVSIELFSNQHGFLFELSNRFDGNDENSVPQWFSQFMFLLIAGSSGLAAYLQSETSKRIMWGVFAVVALLLSIDDVATLHELLLQSLHNIFFVDTAPSFLRNAWLLLLPLILLIAGWLAWWAWKLLPRRTTWWLLVGGVVYVFGKILLDSLANLTDDLFLDAGIAQGLEKLFQYVGSVIIFYAIVSYLEVNYHKPLSRAVKELRLQR